MDRGPPRREYVVVLYEQRGQLEGARMKFDDVASVVLGPGDHALASVLVEIVGCISLAAMRLSNTAPARISESTAWSSRSWSW